MKNKTITSYVIGFLTGLILSPLIDEGLNVALTWIEVTKLKPTKKILSGNHELLCVSELDVRNCSEYKEGDNFDE